MSEEQEFKRIMRSYSSQDLPPVEVVTDKFRAVAKNFFSLPVTVLFELKAAQHAGDGSDLMLLFEAAEMAFEAKDAERLKDLNIRDFLNVIHAWVNFDRGD